MNIQYGVIIQYRYTSDKAGKKLEVKCNVGERPTDWLPVKTQASSFLRVHTPVRIGDQVIVFNPFGENENGFVDRNLSYKDIPLPDEANENTYVGVFEDGTTFLHDVQAKEISLNTPCSINIITNKPVKVVSDKNIDIECSDANIKAKNVVVDSSSIDLGNGGAGVITAESICPFTGSPHLDESKNTRSAK